MIRWPTKPLGEILQFSPERIEPNEHAGQLFNYVGLEHIESNTGRLVQTGHTNGSDIASTKNVFHPGQILYGKLRPYLNKVHLAATDGICSTDILVLEPAAEILAAYAAYFLRSPDVLSQTSTMAKGANLPRLSPRDLALIAIPVPSFPEQRRIVAILDQAENLRTLRQQADHRTADLIPALFHEMFGDPVANPRGWPISSIEQLLVTDRAGLKCGPFGSALKKHEYVSAGIPVWGIESVSPNFFTGNVSLFITREKYAELTTYDVHSGDILISRAGTVGRMCVARTEVTPSIIGTNLIRLSLDQKAVVPEFVSTMFTHFGSSLAKLRANGDEGAYSFVQTRTLKSITIPLPPLPLQKKFAASVADIRDMQQKQAASKKRLDDLFHSLLHRAFRGEL